MPKNKGKERFVQDRDVVHYSNICVLKEKSTLNLSVGFVYPKLADLQQFLHSCSARKTLKVHKNI